MMTQVRKWVYIGLPVFWVVGLLIPALFIFAAAQLWASRKALFADVWIKMLFAFILLQLFALAGATRFDFFDVERGLAGLHNVIAFGFLPIGMLAIMDKDMREEILKYAPLVLFMTGMLVVITSVYAVITRELITYGGVLSWVFENKFTEVNFYRFEDDVVSGFPRTMVLGIFPNSTAFLITSLFILVEFDGRTKWKRGLRLLFLFCIIMTGSRVFLLIALMLLTVVSLRPILIWSKVKKFVPIVAILCMVGAYFLYGLRTGSNSTRIALYQESWNFWMEQAPLLGLGFKPRLMELSDTLPYPLGSHSTWIGYFFKLGWVGGAIALAGLVGVLVSLFKSLMVILKADASMGKGRGLLIVAAVLLLLTTFLDDIDAIATVPLCLGIIIQLFRSANDD